MSRELEANLEMILKGQLEHPDVWAKVLYELTETDSEYRTEALLLLQLVQPVRDFLHTVATGNTEPDRLAALAELLLAGLCPKPMRVTLSHDPDTGEHLLVATTAFGSPARVVEVKYDGDGMNSATRDYANLTEWLRPAAALNLPRDTEA